MEYKYSGIEKGKSMRNNQFISLLTILLFSNAFSQGSTPSSNEVNAVQQNVQLAAPVNASTQVQGKMSSQASPKSQITPKSYTKALTGTKTRFKILMKCDSIYGAEIRSRISDLQKKLMDLMQTEREAECKKQQNNANLQKIQDNFDQLHTKDSIAYHDTSAKKIQLRKEAQTERLAVMYKMQAEEGKVYNDPELVKIRQSIADLRKQIRDTIAVIVKNDSLCLSCYKSR